MNKVVCIILLCRYTQELVYYHGQILAMNECGYRQMYDAKYLLIQDIDEFVVPTQAQDWSSMLDDVSTGFFAVRKDRVGSYSFRNRFFPLDSPDVDHQVFDFDLTRLESQLERAMSIRVTTEGSLLSVIADKPYTHVLAAIFQVNLGCNLNSPSPFIPALCILLGQA